MSQNKVVLDSAMLEKLESAPNGSELCDLAGRTVGVVISPDYYRELLVAWARANFDERRARQADEDYRAGRFKSTKEVLDQLKQLDADAEAAS